MPDDIKLPEPAAWLVCSVNKDGSLSLEHAAAWEEAAHEAINDAINEHGIEDAHGWVVRAAYTADQVRAAVEADRATRSPAANFALARKMGAAHLSDPEMRDTLADLKRRIKTEPGFKRALLQSAGIVDDDGNLTPLYRGGDAEAAHGIPAPKGGAS